MAYLDRLNEADLWQLNAGSQGPRPRFTDAVLRSDFSRGQCGRADFINLRQREFCFSRPLPRPRHHVGRIVDGTPDKKMRRVHALRVVARVANHKSVRNRAIGYLKRNNVSTSRAMGANTDHPVAVSIFCGNPWPTIMWVAPVDLLPESLRERTLLRHSKPPYLSLKGCRPMGRKNKSLEA